MCMNGCIIRLQQIGRLLGVLVVAMVVPVKAQESAQRSIEWNAMSMDATLRDLYYQSPSGMTKVFIPNGGFSKSLTYRGTSPMVFFEMRETPEGEQPVAVAEAVLPADAREVTLFFFRAKNDISRYDTYVVRGSTAEQAAAMGRLINLTPYALTGFVEKTPFNLSPGAMTEVPLDAVERGSVSIRIKAASHQGEGWNREVNSTVGIRPGTHLTVVFRRNDEGRVVMIPIRKSLASPRVP